MRQSFWADAAKEFLEDCGRQDLIDKGDALAERVAALILTAMNRLKQYCHDDLYNGRGGLDVLNDSEALVKIDDFVNVRLRKEIEALEQLLETFEDLRSRHEEEHNIPSKVSDTYDIDLPDWY